MSEASHMPCAQGGAACECGNDVPRMAARMPVRFRQACGAAPDHMRPNLISVIRAFGTGPHLPFGDGPCRPLLGSARRLHHPWRTCFCGRRAKRRGLPGMHAVRECRPPWGFSESGQAVAGGNGRTDARHDIKMFTGMIPNLGSNDIPLYYILTSIKYTTNI